MILQNMDELFLLPPAPVAMPRAYWMLPDADMLSSQVILIQPSKTEFSRVQARIDSASKNDYDMEIVNDLYGHSALVLPHRPYDMITGEYREENHTKYLGSDAETWDPVAAYNEAKLIHFSDWPIPKPWIPTPDDLQLEIQPPCKQINGTEDCTGRIIWNSFYTDFKLKRKVSQVGRYCLVPCSLTFYRRFVVRIGELDKVLAKGPHVEIHIITSKSQIWLDRYIYLVAEMQAFTLKSYGTRINSLKTIV